MSMSAFLSSLSGAGRQHLTASTISATQLTCSHLLRINGYARVREMLANGQALRSGTFSLGGHDWNIKCYPNGCSQKHEGSISLFLEHASHAKTGDTTAKIGVSILPDVTSKPACSRSITECRFTKDGLDWGWRDFIKHEDLDKDKHLKDDCLNLLCDVTVAGPITDDYVEVAAPESESTAVVGPEPRVLKRSAPPFDLRGHLAVAIWNKQPVDVNIEVGGETFPAHRWVLEAGSPVFKADLSLASVTGDKIAVLHVDGVDAQVFKALLRFMYTDTPPRLESATMAERMLVAADRFELDKLKLICEEALCQHIDTSSLAATLALAERHHSSMLRTACMQFLSTPGNLEAFIAAGGYAQLKTDCPSAVVELATNKML